MEMQLATICHENLDAFRDLNLAIFPIVYNDKFYKDVLLTYPVLLSRIAYFNGNPVGAISCRKELVSGFTQAYIMTIGVLEDYRRAGLGSEMLRRIIASCDHDADLQRLCLHVHVSNSKAISFYARHGFHIESVVNNYYEKNSNLYPPDAYHLVRAKSFSQIRS